MKYISQPPLLLDVHIHKPLLPARTWMDSLLAFFPGLQVGLMLCNFRFFLWAMPFHQYWSYLHVPQVLKGDIRPAIETHEMLYQVTKKHNFLPEVIFFLYVLNTRIFSSVTWCQLTMMSSPWTWEERTCSSCPCLPLLITCLKWFFPDIFVLCLSSGLHYWFQGTLGPASPETRVCREHIFPL